MRRLIFAFGSHVIPQVVRPLRALWNQLIGFIFLLLAVAGTGSGIVNVRHSHGEGEDFGRIIVAFLFAAIMAYFSITSFLRARKISR